MEETGVDPQQYGRRRSGVPPGASGDAPSRDDPQGPTDAELLRAGRRDEAAFRELVRRHGRYLYGVAHSLGGNPADAEDLVQETLVAALEATYRGEAAVRTFLVRILVRRAAMLARSRRRGGGAVPLAGAGAEPAVPSAVGRADARLDLATMLEALSPEHREVIVLRELEGMSYDGMAAALGVPRGTVESRLHRARAELRRRFAGY